MRGEKRLEDLSRRHPAQRTETPGWLHAHTVIAICRSPCANSLKQMASRRQIC